MTQNEALKELIKEAVREALAEQRLIRAREGTPAENASARRVLDDAYRLVIQVIQGGSRMDHGGDSVQAMNWKTAINALQIAQKQIRYAQSQLT